MCLKYSWKTTFCQVTVSSNTRWAWRGYRFLTQDEPERFGQLVYDWDMQLIMNDRQLQTVERVRGFLEGSEAVEFKGLTAQEKYCWIEEVLIRFRYHRLKRDEKGSA